MREQRRTQAEHTFLDGAHVPPPSPDGWRRTSAVLFFALVQLGCSSDAPHKHSPSYDKQLRSCADAVVLGCNDVLETPDEHGNCVRNGMRKCMDV